MFIFFTTACAQPPVQKSDSKNTIKKKIINLLLIGPLTKLHMQMHHWDPISKFHINSHQFVFHSLNIFVLYQPTRFFIASERLGASAEAICWGKRVVRNSESEMAARRCSPWGTSSVITPRILLCRPWTLTSQSTLGNHLLPHTSQNKACRGFLDAPSWHVERELTVNEHSFKIVLCKQWSVENRGDGK